MAKKSDDEIIEKLTERAQWLKHVAFTIAWHYLNGSAMYANLGRIMYFGAALWHNLQLFFYRGVIKRHEARS